MKNGILGAVLVVGVAAGVLLLWGARKGPGESQAAMSAGASDALAYATADVASGVASAETASSDVASRDAIAVRSPVSADQTNDARRTSTPSRAPTPAALQPLTLEQEQRLEAFVDALAEDSNDARDLEVLVDNEAHDPDWSDLTERRIEDALRRHGSRLTALHAGAPYCTQTVCRMLATGGFDTSAANADWQGLVSDVLNDPALRNTFMDTRTTVQGGTKGMMYVTYLVRRTAGDR